MAMVLPDPGGPVTVVSGPRAPSAMSLSICGRRTAQEGGRGMVIFDIRTGSSAPVACPLGRAAARAPKLGVIGVTPDPADPGADPYEPVPRAHRLVRWASSSLSSPSRHKLLRAAR